MRISFKYSDFSVAFLGLCSTLVEGIGNQIQCLPFTVYSFVNSLNKMCAIIKLL